MGLLEYFDLNRRSRKGNRKASAGSVIAATTLREFREAPDNPTAFNPHSERSLESPSQPVPSWKPGLESGLESPPTAPVAIEPPRSSPSRSLWNIITQRQEGQLSIVDQILMYFGILLGIYFSSLIRGQQSQLSLWIAALVALIIIPVVFEKLNVDPQAPFIVRFGLFVQNGVFWDVIFESLGQLTRR